MDKNTLGVYTTLTALRRVTKTTDKGVYVFNITSTFEAEMFFYEHHPKDEARAKSLYKIEYFNKLQEAVKYLMGLYIVEQERKFARYEEQIPETDAVRVSGCKY